MPKHKDADSLCCWIQNRVAWDQLSPKSESKATQPNTDLRGTEVPSLATQVHVPESSLTLAFSVAEAIKYIFYYSQFGLDTQSLSASIFIH